MDILMGVRWVEGLPARVPMVDNNLKKKKKMFRLKGQCHTTLQLKNGRNQYIVAMWF